MFVDLVVSSIESIVREIVVVLMSLRNTCQTQGVVVVDLWVENLYQNSEIVFLLTALLALSSGFVFCLCLPSPLLCTL